MLEKDVPLVGQPVTLISWYPTTLLKCNCVEGLNIVIVTGFNNTVMCGNCRRSYMVRGLHPDGRLDLIMMLPTPEGTVQ